MQISPVKRDWARSASEYCKAVAPYATPLLKTATDLFASISATRDQLLVEETEQLIGRE